NITINIFSSVDDGVTWDPLLEGNYVDKCEEINNTGTFKIKCVIESFLAELFKEDTAKIYSIYFTFSNQPIDQQ
ncbi:MAG: hypothetical protein ACOCRK_10615, partial [bacterium]